jgi:ABC-type glutathione transport system ATPase component
MLQIRDLHIGLSHENAGREILGGVSLDVPEGSIAGLSGASGCGKSTLALAILGLLPPDRYRVRGQILFRGRSLLGLTDQELARVRGAQISIIFQDPLLALNPVLRVRTQITEILRAHGVRRDPAELIALAGLADAARILDAYPYQLSGGERQRVTIAQALACRPPLIIADEPFTALDAPRTVELIALFRRLRAELGTSFLLISHTPGVLATAADHIYSLTGGRIQAAQPTGAADVR